MIEAQFGGHTIRLHGPALFHVIAGGDLSAEEMLGLVRFIKEGCEGRPHLLILNDLSKLGSISPEARKLAMSEGSELPVRVLAYHGASFTTRAAVTLAMGAMRLLSSTSCQFRFFGSEAEARAWIEEEHRKLYPEGPASA